MLTSINCPTVANARKLAGNLVMTALKSVNGYLIFLRNRDNVDSDVLKSTTAHQAFCLIARDLCEMVYSYLIAKGDDIIEINVSSLAATISGCLQTANPESAIFAQFCRLLFSAADVKITSTVSIKNGIPWGSSLLLLLLLLQQRDVILVRIREQFVSTLINKLPPKKRYSAQLLF
jgi:hypothetical protein